MIRWGFLSVVPAKDGGGGEALPKFSESSVFKSKHRIGRETRCETCLDGFSVVSSEHCHITTDFAPGAAPGEEGKVFLRAFLTDDSTNGTMVGKRTLRRWEVVELEEGSEISMRGKATPFKLVFHYVALTPQEVEQVRLQQQSSSRTSLSPSPSSLSSPSFRPSSSASAPRESLVGPEELAKLRSRVQQVEDALGRESALHQDTKRVFARELELKTKALSALHEDFGKKERAKRVLDEQLVDERKKTTQLMVDKDLLEKSRVDLTAERDRALELGAELAQVKLAHEGQLAEASRQIALQLERQEHETAEHDSNRQQLEFALQTQQNEVSRLGQQLDTAQVDRLASKQRFELDLQRLQGEVDHHEQMCKDRDAALLAVGSELKLARQDLAQAQHDAALTSQSVQEASAKQEREIASMQQAHNALQARFDKLLQAKTEAVQEAAKQADLVIRGARKLDETEQRLQQETLKTVQLATKVQELNVLCAQAEAISSQAKEYKEKALAAEDELRSQALRFTELEEQLRQQVALERGELERVRREMVVERGEFETNIAVKLDSLRFVERMMASSLLPNIRIAIDNAARPASHQHTQFAPFESSQEEGEEDVRQPTPRLEFDSPIKQPLMMEQTEDDDNDDKEEPSNNKRMRQMEAAPTQLEDYGLNDTCLSTNLLV